MSTEPPPTVTDADRRAETLAANLEADEVAAAYGVGWKIFTGSMLILSSIFTLIFAVIAVSDASWFRTVAGPDVRLPTESTIETWGWIGLVVGFVVLLAGFGVFWGTMWARVAGVAGSVLNILIHVRFSHIFPWWSVATIFLDVIVIYGLVLRVHPLTPEQLAALQGRTSGRTT